MQYHSHIEEIQPVGFPLDRPSFSSEATRSRWVMPHLICMIIIAVRFRFVNAFFEIFLFVLCF